MHKLLITLSEIVLTEDNGDKKRTGKAGNHVFSFFHVCLLHADQTVCEIRYTHCYVSIHNTLAAFLPQCADITPHLLHNQHRPENISLCFFMLCIMARRLQYNLA